MTRPGYPGRPAGLSRTIAGCDNPGVDSAAQRGVILLLLLNGPPAAGKSTVAQRWVDGHPLALNLDLDRLWPMLGGWSNDLTATGVVVRELALAMARAQLGAGRDVVVPQYLARPEFIDELAALAGPRFRHVVLLPPYEVVAARFQVRPDHPVAAAGLARSGSADELRVMYDRLVALARRRDDAEIIELSGTEALDHAIARIERP